MPVTPFEQDTELSAIAIAYKNDKANYIADKVFPYITVGEPNFKYNEYPLEEGFSVPNTLVGRTSKPETVEFSAISKTASVEDYGLDAPVPNYDVSRAPKNYNPKHRAVEGVADLLMLAREIRAAKLARDVTNYGFKETLTTGSQWDDETSDPISAILEASDKMLLRPNALVLGLNVWTKLRLHPKIVKATHGNSGDSGVASRQAVAELLEIPEIIVGTSRYNTSKKGQKATIEPCWEEYAALLHINQNADTNNGVTFGFTARFGDKVAGSFVDQNMGLRGGEVVRVGETCKELVIAPGCGYLFEQPLSK